MRAAVSFPRSFGRSFGLLALGATMAIGAAGCPRPKMPSGPPPVYEEPPPPPWLSDAGPPDTLEESAPEESAPEEEIPPSQPAP